MTRCTSTLPIAGSAVSGWRATCPSRPPGIVKPTGTPGYCLASEEPPVPPGAPISERFFPPAISAAGSDPTVASEPARWSDNAPALHPRGRPRHGRDPATTAAYVNSRRERKKVEMLFAHLKRILRLDRLRLRGPNGARDEFLLAATARNLRKLAKLTPPGPQAVPACGDARPPSPRSSPPTAHATGLSSRLLQRNRSRSAASSSRVRFHRRVAGG